MVTRGPCHWDAGKAEAGLSVPGLQSLPWSALACSVSLEQLLAFVPVEHGNSSGLETGGASWQVSPLPPGMVPFLPAFPLGVGRGYLGVLRKWREGTCK